MSRATKLGLLGCVLLIAGCSGSADSSVSDVAGGEEETQGVGQRLVASDPCATVRCAAGTRCVANGSTATCEANVFCGGIAAFPCPGAGECVDDPNDSCDPDNGGADCGGVCACSGAAVLCGPNTVFDESPEICACVEFENPCNLLDCPPNSRCEVNNGEPSCVANVQCGGFSGEPCPGAGTCVDDRSDDCDPENGGADCGGLCECSGALVLCAPEAVFDESPDVCGCVPSPSVGCEAVLCITGTHCVERDGQAECVPNRHRPHRRHGRHQPRRPHGKRHH
jgi:hypothetical protein